MREKINELIKKYKDLIPYLIFGVCTTIVNIVVYAICARGLGISTVASTIIAWILSVAFAYFTNRKWVFKSEAKTWKAILREATYFVACRLATGIMDVVIMWLFVDVLHWNDILVKIASNVLVVIVNYIASKFFIFRKKPEPEN